MVDDQPITRVFDTLPIKTGDFTMTEIWEAVKSTQGNKATGLDGIPAEVWKETYPICGLKELFCPSLRREIWAVHQTTEISPDGSMG